MPKYSKIFNEIDDFLSFFSFHICLFLRIENRERLQHLEGFSYVFDVCTETSLVAWIELSDNQVIINIFGWIRPLNFLVVWHLLIRFNRAPSNHYSMRFNASWPIDTSDFVLKMRCSTVMIAANRKIVNKTSRWADCY